MGPVSARSYPGKELVLTRSGEEQPAGRARQELEHDRDRERGGYVFGAFRPDTGEALTATRHRRNVSTFVEFLEEVEAWIPPGIDRVYAILDNLKTHKSYDVLFFNLAYPRWEFVFQPKYAAYLNLIEPWWKTLKSLALKGRFFETWEEIEAAVGRASEYWNKHRHPYVWGRRRRHRRTREPGVGAMPNVASVEQ